MTIDELAKDIPRIQQAHGLRDFGFDTECIYELGDLSRLVIYVVGETFPEKTIHLHEELSADKKYFIATLTTPDATILFRTHTASDWLSDEFFEALEALPAALGSEDKFYSINPAVGLTGQEAWYFCGPEAQLKAARQEGLPLVFPDENFMETEEYRKYVGD
jgi:hypothetical protein